MKKKALFIDKDGTLIPDLPFNVDPGKVFLNEGVPEALQHLALADYEFVIISNQPGVALGYFTATELEQIEKRICTLFNEADLHLAGFYYCPHAPLPGHQDACECRKPKPGLLFKAASELGINLKKSWMIGDILHDVEAGNRAGCQTILLDNGHETQWQKSPWRVPDGICPDWSSAAHLILDAPLKEAPYEPPESILNMQLEKWR